MFGLFTAGEITTLDTRLLLSRGRCFLRCRFEGVFVFGLFEARNIHTLFLSKVRVRESTKKADAVYYYYSLCVGFIFYTKNFFLILIIFCVA